MTFFKNTAVRFFLIVIVFAVVSCEKEPVNKPQKGQTLPKELKLDFTNLDLNIDFKTEFDLSGKSMAEKREFITNKLIEINQELHQDNEKPKNRISGFDAQLSGDVFIVDNPKTNGGNLEVDNKLETPKTPKAYLNWNAIPVDFAKQAQAISTRLISSDSKIKITYGNEVIEYILKKLPY